MRSSTGSRENPVFCWTRVFDKRGSGSKDAGVAAEGKVGSLRELRAAAMLASPSLLLRRAIYSRLMARLLMLPSGVYDCAVVLLLRDCLLLRRDFSFLLMARLLIPVGFVGAMMMFSGPNVVSVGDRSGCRRSAQGLVDRRLGCRDLTSLHLSRADPAFAEKPRDHTAVQLMSSAGERQRRTTGSTARLLALR